MADRPPPTLTGALNFRDVGGLAAAAGLRVRTGTLYRSDTLQFLTPDDVGTLLRLGLRTEIDLRRAEEARREGRGLLQDAPVAYALFPMRSSHDHLDGPTDVPMITSAQPVADHYLGYLERSGPQVAGAVRTLAAPGALPALVHCAAGKDRTGVVVAFALSVAGVDDDTIAAEYALRPDGVAAAVERLRGLPGYGRTINALPPAVHITPPEYMQTFLRQVRALYGSPRCWLARHGGVTEAELDGLAAALTGP